MHMHINAVGIWTAQSKPNNLITETRQGLTWAERRKRVGAFWTLDPVDKLRFSLSDKGSYQTDRVIPKSEKGDGQKETQQRAAPKVPLGLLWPWFGSQVSTPWESAMVLEPLTSLVWSYFPLAALVVVLESKPCYMEWDGMGRQIMLMSSAQPPGKDTCHVTLGWHSTSWGSAFSSAAPHSIWPIWLFNKILAPTSHVYQIWKFQIPQIGYRVAWLYLN